MCYGFCVYENHEGECSLTHRERASRCPDRNIEDWLDKPQEGLCATQDNVSGSKCIGLTSPVQSPANSDALTK